MVYIPSSLLDVKDAERLASYVEQELRAISQELGETTELELRPRSVAPSRPREGMLVYADGITFNPGAGEGVYVFKNGAFELLNNVAGLSYFAGIWTPTLTFTVPGNLNIAYSFNVGNYTKIGREVLFDFQLSTSVFTHSTASGSMEIHGFPFPVAPGVVVCLAFSGHRGITKPGYTTFNLFIGGDPVSTNAAACGSGLNFVSLTPADIPSGGSLIFAMSGRYPSTS
jgi:hypothetical protein